MYNPINPISVNHAFPAATRGEIPCAVRINPWISQGCRPNSAVIHPAVFAMYGSGAQSISVQSIHRESYNFPRHKSSAATTITAMKIVPSPTIK